jgi:hypothetical protein
VFAVFVATFVEDLHADADAEKRFARGDRREHGASRPRSRARHRGPERAVARQDRGARRRDHRGIGAHAEIGAATLERGDQRAEIAAAVIDDRDHAPTMLFSPGIAGPAGSFAGVPLTRRCSIGT